MFKRYLVLLASLFLIITGCANEPTAPGNTHAEWDYEAIGDWPKGYPECGGLFQSPINIVTAEAIQANIPAAQGYWMYTGSLTTQPCSQGLSFYVMKEHKTLSAAQIQTFAANYENNARPILPQNGRPVLDHD